MRFLSIEQRGRDEGKGAKVMASGLMSRDAAFVF